MVRNPGEKNPDVVVDEETGEIYVETQDGQVHTDDSLGNINEESTVEKQAAKRGRTQRGGQNWDPTSVVDVGAAGAGAVGIGGAVWWGLKLLSPLCGPAVVACAVVG